MKLKLGDQELPSNLLTSPLCGISNRPFRLLAKRFGSALSYVEMLKARTVVDKHPKAMALMKYYADEKPLGAQFASSDPGYLGDACKMAQDMGFDTIDLNSGCPAGRVGKELCGARLMSRPDVAAKLMASMKSAVDIPVTVKIRAGMDDKSLNFLEFGRIAQEEGMEWITLHPRTRAQGYKGVANHERTAELKAHVNIPVIASGDVKEPDDALKITDHHGVDGVMIGRGIYGKPWLFRRIIAAQNGQAEPDMPPPREVLHVLRWHFEGLMEIFNPRTACVLQRRYSGWYIKGIRGAPAWRARFVRIDTPEEFYKNWHQCDAELAEMENAGEIEVADKDRLIWERSVFESQGLGEDDLFSAQEKASAPVGRETVSA